MQQIYRPGAIGALADEHERAAHELQRLIEGVSDEDFELVRDLETTDESCRSIQTILNHVVRAAYGYADYIRTSFGTPTRSATRSATSRRAQGSTATRPAART